MAVFIKQHPLHASPNDYFQRVLDNAIFVCKRGGTYQLADRQVDFSRPLFVAVGGLIVPVVGEPYLGASELNSVVEPLRVAKEFMVQWKAWGGTITMPLQLRDLIDAIAIFQGR